MNFILKTLTLVFLTLLAFNTLALEQITGNWYGELKKHNIKMWMVVEGRNSNICTMMDSVHKKLNLAKTNLIKTVTATELKYNGMDFVKVNKVPEWCLAKIKKKSNNSYLTKVKPKKAYEKYSKPIKGCNSVEYPTLFDGKDKIVEGKKIFGGKKLFDGQVSCFVAKDEDSQLYTKYEIESGIYKGIKYRLYHSNGSGSIQGKKNNVLALGERYKDNWSTNCEIDVMDDKHWCSISKSHLQIGIDKSGEYFLNIGWKHYPDSKIVVRVDQNKLISSNEKVGFSSAQIKLIVKAMKTGVNVTTRYQEWPYQRNIDEKWDLWGYVEAIEILEKMYSEISLEN